MALSDVVYVVVNVNQSTVAQQGFGVPLIYAHHTHSERVLTFKASNWDSAMTALEPQGLGPGTAAYQCAAAMMRQSPRPIEFKVGRRSKAERQVVHLIPSGGSGSAEIAWAVTIESPYGTSETATFAGDAATTIAAACTGLAAAINALTDTDVTADGSGGTFVQVTADDDNYIYSFHSLKRLTLEDHTDLPDNEGDPTVAQDLTAIREADNDWYALCLPSSSPDHIEACADWIEGQEKIFVAQTHDYRPLTSATDDVVSSIKAQGYDRTHVAYNSRAGTFYGAAWTAVMLPYEPGQADWKFKLVKGVVADKLTATEENYLLDKNGSYYEPLIKGRDATGAAKGGSGLFLDLKQLSDWLAARTVEGIVSMLTASPKVPFTDQGAGNSIWGVLKSVLDQGIQNTAIDEDPDTWSIVVPKRAQLPPADVQARNWSGCILNCMPTGAVHSVKPIVINLNVTAS